MNETNYRKIYENKTGLKIPKGYEIHHIDMNRKNNDFSNLIMLPKKLHKKYHSTIEECSNHIKGEELILNICVEQAGCICYDSYIFEKIKDVLLECSIWLDYKKYLVGEMPNVHNIVI